ncbi:hypothetical protein D3C79_755120 [compost metagenome]
MLRHTAEHGYLLIHRSAAPPGNVEKYLLCKVLHKGSHPASSEPVLFPCNPLQRVIYSTMGALCCWPILAKLPGCGAQYRPSAQLTFAPHPLAPRPPTLGNSTQTTRFKQRRAKYRTPCAINPAAPFRALGTAVADVLPDAPSPWARLQEE